MNQPIRRSRLAPDQHVIAFTQGSEPDSDSPTIPSANAGAPTAGGILADVPVQQTSTDDPVQEQKALHVIVTDIRMPFGSMVAFLVKASFAAIPATLIIAMVWAFFVGLISGLFKYR